jgi:glycosyltransferase involved in cell wall biosynthesis
VPLAKLIGNHSNLEFWLSSLPEGAIHIILVHDIQDKETAEIINQILVKIADPRIEYREGKFGAPGLARNFGMSSIDSEWFWFVDADDLPEIHNVLSELGNVDGNFDIVVGKFVVISQESSNTKRTYFDLSSLSDLARNPGIWRIIFKTEVFELYRFQDFRMAEDQIFLIDIDFFERRIKISKYIFYTYFKHQQGQLTSQKSAILDLAKTIPVVIAKIKEQETDKRKYLELMLARQIGTQFKFATWGERMRTIKLNSQSVKQLPWQSRVRTLIELSRVIFNKLIMVNNG